MVRAAKLNPMSPPLLTLTLLEGTEYSGCLPVLMREFGGFKGIARGIISLDPTFVGLLLPHFATINPHS